MKEIRGDIWTFYNKGYWIVITTNGTVKKNGKAVMGRGVALQAKKRFPELPEIIGTHIRYDRSKVDFLFSHRIISFPVKNNWWEKGSLILIERSCNEMLNLLTYEPYREIKEVYLVRPGCGNGQLNWEDVRPILEKYLDDRFVVVEW